MFQEQASAAIGVPLPILNGDFRSNSTRSSNDVKSGGGGGGGGAHFDEHGAARQYVDTLGNWQRVLSSILSRAVSLLMHREYVEVVFESECLKRMRDELLQQQQQQQQSSSNAGGATKR